MILFQESHSEEIVRRIDVLLEVCPGPELAARLEAVARRVQRVRGRPVRKFSFARLSGRQQAQRRRAAKKSAAKRKGKKVRKVRVRRSFFRRR